MASMVSCEVLPREERIEDNLYSESYVAEADEKRKNSQVKSRLLRWKFHYASYFAKQKGDRPYDMNHSS